MSEKKPKECQKCGFVDCKCDSISKISYATPDFDNHRKIEPNFELDKIKEELNKIKKTENLEIKKLQQKVKLSKDDQEIIVLSKLIIELDPTTFAAYTDLTSALMRSKQIDEAEKWYRKLITKIDSMDFPPNSNMSFRSYFGYILYENKKYDEALDNFNKHLDSVKVDPFSWYWKAVILQEHQKYKDALDCCEKIIAMNAIHEIKEPFDNLVSLAWTEKADIQNSLGEYENALESIDKAISITDESLKATNVWIGKGVIYQNLDNHENALQCFEKALSFDGNNVLILNYKAVELAVLGRFDEAEICCRDIIAINKFHSYAWANLASIYLQKERNFTKAFECSAISIFINPVNTIGMELHAMALMSFKKFNEALEIIERLIIIDKGIRLSSVLMKAELLSTMNFKSKALECYDQILSKNILKDHELLLCLLKKSKLLYDTQEFEKLITICNKILAIDENNEEALICKCAALNEVRKFPECLDCCNKLLTINENSIEALNISSVVLKGLGRISESIETSKKMLTIDENVPFALFNLGAILKEQKKYPEALKYINKFLEVNPTDPNAPIEDAKKLRDELIKLIQSK